MNFKNSALKTTVISIIAVIAVLGILTLSFYFDINAYREIGENFLEVFFTNFQAKLIAQAVSFIIVFAIIYISIIIIKNNLIKVDSLYEFMDRKGRIFIISVILSMLASGIIQSTVYERLLLFLSPTFLNSGDPIFFKDIGYYLFQRPFLSSLIDSVQSVLLIVFLGVFVVYMFLYARLGITKVTDIFKIKSIAIHNIVNLTLIIIAKILSFGIKAEEMLYSASGSFVGAGYTDISIWKLYYTIMPYILIAILFLAIIFMYNGKIKLGIGSVLIYPVVYAVFLTVSLFTDTFVVKPQEVTIEAPYIANSIKYTKNAYNINNVENKIYDISYDLNKDTLEKERNVLSNTRIIDYESTVKAINQVQGIRNYYKFNDIDIVKYDFNGVPTAVAMAPREFNKENIDETAKTFINEKLRFTHGFGITATLVNSVTSEGLPNFIIKDIPPQSSEKSLKVTQPRIYYGELNDDYVIVNSNYKELDYSEGDQDVEYSYTGKSGIKMNLLNKLLYSFHYGDFQLLISKFVDSDSSLLINRNVVDRVKKVAPFLSVDDDPYILVDDEGRVKWIVNCYTTSSYYPYSQPIVLYGEYINYIRESVKAVVDAYDGTVKFYITDETDPVAQSYKKVYPSFFEEGTLPKDLITHIQYPETMFTVQAEILKRYHTENPEIFYNKTDMWDFAKEKYENEDKYVKPYYSIMSLFGDKEELVLMIPYTMVNKQNLVAWMAVSCDEEHYGKKLLYTFPKGQSVYGIMQVENKIDNDPDISREMTLWGQGGSSVIRGNMLAIPVGNSIIYVEPVYISSGNQTSLPELKRIILAYNDKIVMEETFEKALYKMFDFKLTPSVELTEPVNPEVVPEPEITPELAPDSSVIELFDSIKKSMAEGNWEAFGKNFSLLEQEINKMREQ